MHTNHLKPTASAVPIAHFLPFVSGRLLPAVFLACALWWFCTLSMASAAPLAQGDTTCNQPLPTIEWLGEGAGTYTLGENFDTFIVKRRSPFRFVTERGTVNSQGETVYQATGNERVWRCAGNCQLPAAYHDAFTLGDLAVGATVKLVVIDDDLDDRRNWWAVGDPMDPYLIVEEQDWVEYLTFDIPVAGTWYYYAQDSIGIAAVCIQPAAPTPTATPTPSPTSSPTSTPTATPTVTATPTPTTTPTATPTFTTTPVPTNTPSSTPTVTAPPSATSTPTVTPTATPTATPTVVVSPTAGVTPTATPRIPPTALQLVYFRATPVMDETGEQIALTWETVFETGVREFQIWRSTTGVRGDAVLITDAQIASRGTSANGATYRFVDDEVTLGTEYTYWLEQVTTNGTREDVAVTKGRLVFSLYLPVVSR